jgi:hypothetical protein
MENRSMVGLGDTIHQVEADEECAILLGDVAPDLVMRGLPHLSDIVEKREDLDDRLRWARESKGSKILVSDEFKRLVLSSLQIESKRVWSIHSVLPKSIHRRLSNRELP